MMKVGLYVKPVVEKSINTFYFSMYSYIDFVRSLLERSNCT